MRFCCIGSICAKKNKKQVVFKKITIICNFRFVKLHLSKSQHKEQCPLDETKVKMVGHNAQHQTAYQHNMVGAVILVFLLQQQVLRSSV